MSGRRDKVCLPPFGVLIRISMDDANSPWGELSASLSTKQTLILSRNKPHDTPTNNVEPDIRVPSIWSS